MRKKIIQKFCKQTGVTKTFLALSLGMSCEGFEYALQRGFRDDEEKKLKATIAKLIKTAQDLDTTKLLSEGK